MMAVSGWLSSCASAAPISSMAETRAIWTRSACSSLTRRSCSLRGRRSRMMPMNWRPSGVMASPQNRNARDPTNFGTTFTEREVVPRLRVSMPISAPAWRLKRPSR